MDAAEFGAAPREEEELAGTVEVDILEVELVEAEVVDAGKVEDVCGAGDLFEPLFVGEAERVRGDIAEEEAAAGAEGAPGAEHGFDGVDAIASDDEGGGSGRFCAKDALQYELGDGVREAGDEEMSGPGVCVHHGEGRCEVGQVRPQL